LHIQNTQFQQARVVAFPTIAETISAISSGLQQVFTSTGRLRAAIDPGNLVRVHFGQPDIQCRLHDLFSSSE
jgi:hypothetical protein